MEAGDKGTVTIVIERARKGDRPAQDELCARYFDRLARLAYRTVRLHGRPAISEDEEDAANSALQALCDGIARGKWPDVVDREGLWALVAKITENKALRQVERWKAACHGGGLVFNEADLTAGQPSRDGGLDRIHRVEPTPAYVALVRDNLRMLLEVIEREDPRWKEVVLMMLEGQTVPEVAGRMGRTNSMVYVWLRAIRARLVEIEGGGED